MQRFSPTRKLQAWADSSVVSCRSFYAGLDDSRLQRLRRSSMTFNRPRGRDTLSLAFEQRVRILPLTGVGDLYAFPSLSHETTDVAPEATKRPLRVLVVELLSLDAVEAVVPYPAAHPLYYAGWSKEGEAVKGETNEELIQLGDAGPFSHGEGGRVISSNNRRQLRQNGDTTLLHGLFVKRGSDDTYAHYALVQCINPFLDVERFRREEAQVEMISAYRNVLYEAVEFPGGVADVVRICALSCDTCGSRFLHEIGKLNQQSLIKGFHRIGNDSKEALLLNPGFRLEVYVPPSLLKQFERAFLEDAWATPESTINPGRTTLYPGLPPPRTLLQLDGWVGKRPELVEAIETQGRSMMRGTQNALDGTPVTEREVLAEIRVFGRERDQEAMLERERATAVQQGYKSEGSRSDALLQPGIGQL